MANWRSYIDPSVGDGQNTIDGIIANGPTYGIAISDDLSVTGLSTFSDIARFSSTVRLDGQLRDGDNNFGSSGQVLSSDGTDTRWVSSGSLAAGAASLVGINDDSNTNAERFLTFVDSSSGNNALKTDSAIKYNPSTNILNLNATGSGIKFGPGDASNDDAHIEWLGGSNDGKLRISTSDDTGTEYIQFGDYDLLNRTGTFTEWLRISRSTGTFTGTFSATTFSGSGASLTSLNASNISSGTINAARVPTLNQNTTGSAATLTTTRSIGGVNFNGSANINLPGVNQAGNQNTSGNAATATVLETTRNFSISGEITANAQSFNGSGNVTLSATVDDNIIDEANLKISNSPTNGRFLQCNTGVSGGLTWAEVTLPTSNTLSGSTLSSGITASSITSLGTLTGLSVNGNVSVTGTVDGRDVSSDGSKLDGIESGATADQTKSDIDGLNINADLLDGEHGSYYRNAGNLNAGTIPDARFPSTLPAISGANLTNLDASDLSSGTMPAARLPNHSASLLTSGTIPAARVPTLNQNTTGSAATLTTARTIAGTSFNGSANIDINYNNLTNKPTIPTNTNQLTNGSGFITSTDVRSMNEATSTNLSSTTSTVYQDKVTLSINTVSNSRVLVLFGFEIKHSRNNNQRTRAKVTGTNVSFVNGDFDAENTDMGFVEFQGHRLDVSSHTGTRTYKVQWNRSADTGSIQNAFLVAIEMSV